jgi:hypothetical protein
MPEDLSLRAQGTRQIRVILCIYRIDPNCDYGSLASLFSRADQTIDTEQIAEQWDRMA